MSPQHASSTSNSQTTEEQQQGSNTRVAADFGDSLAGLGLSVGVGGAVVTTPAALDDAEASTKGPDGGHKVLLSAQVATPAGDSGPGRRSAIALLLTMEYQAQLTANAQFEAQPKLQQLGLGGDGDAGRITCCKACCVRQQSSHMCPHPADESAIPWLPLPQVEATLLQAMTDRAKVITLAYRAGADQGTAK